MKQDEELEQLLGEIPSSAEEEPLENRVLASASSAGAARSGFPSDDPQQKQHYADFYHSTSTPPFSAGTENHPQMLRSAPLESAAAAAAPAQAQAHFDAADASSALWKLSLNGGTTLRPNHQSFSTNSVPNGGFCSEPGTPFAAAASLNAGGAPRVWYNNRQPETKNDMNRIGMMNTVQLNPYATAGGPANLVIAGYSHEEVMRFINHHISLQQFQQQQQIMEDQARRIAELNVQQQPGGMQLQYFRKQQQPNYSNGYDQDRSRCLANIHDQHLVSSRGRNGFNLQKLTKQQQLAYHHHHPQSLANGYHHRLATTQVILEDEQQQCKYSTVKEVKGHIFAIARDQHGCRFLQRKFDDGTSEDAGLIFGEIIDHIEELMMDPFGNYLVQKILEACSDAQRLQILEAVTRNSQLVTISLNMHGTRAVQKLIETVQTAEQINMVISALKPGLVMLIKDSNGNHVVQRCLLRLRKEHNQFIFDTAVSHCVEIAAHRHGCCVLQRCVDSASGAQRDRLIAEIAANAFVLSQDAFGNYVVQYVLDLGYPWASREIISRLAGKFAELAMQKFSSNVVEKCLKLSEDDQVRNSVIIQELIAFPSFDQLLHHEYANYVIQSALASSKGSLLLHNLLENAIRPHLPALRSSPYGKRILSRTSLKK